MPDFGLCWPQFGLQIFFPYVLLDVINYFKQSLYAISRKINAQNLRKFKKISFRPNFGQLGPNSTHYFFFFQNIWLCQSLDIMVRCHHVQYQKNPTIEFWENLETDRRTDKQTDGRDWFYRTLSNKRQGSKKGYKIKEPKAIKENEIIFETL